MKKPTVAKLTPIPKAKPMYLAAWDHRTMLSKIYVTRKTKTTIFTLGRFQHLIGECQTAEVELIPANLPGIFIDASIDEAVEWLAAQAQAESEKLERAQRQMVYQAIDLSSLCMNLRKWPSHEAIYLKGYSDRVKEREKKNDKDKNQD